MAGKKDIVEQALKLVMGVSDDAAKAGIKTYHGTPQPTENLIELFHGTTPEAFDAITSSGNIFGSSRFSPRRDVAETFAYNVGGDANTVVKVKAPASSLMIDLDLPAARLLTPDQAATYLDKPDWTILDFIENGYSVGVPDTSILSIDRAAGGRTGYAGRGRVVGDAVDAAMRLVMGGAETAAPKVAYHATQEPFENYDWSRLGQTTKENTSGTSVEDWALALARLGPWSHEKPLSKKIGMRTDLPVMLTGKEREFKSLDHLAKAISRHGGPEALRGKLVSKGYGHVSVNDEEFGGKSYIGLSPEYFSITKAAGGRTGYQTKGRVVEKALKAVTDYFAPNTDEYAANLGKFYGSTDPALRKRFYTGTSKDKDFTAFQESRHGTWLTDSPEDASSYALSNDSMGYRPGPGWTYEKTNQASRVIPAYAKIENPYRGEKPDWVMKQDNYKKAQSDWFDQLRSQGYDAWVPDSSNGSLAVVLKNQGTNVKSAIGNQGTFDTTKKHMGKSEGGRTGYGPGGVIDDIVKMAGKIVSGADEPAKTGIRAYQGSPHNFAAERLVRFPDKTEQYIVGTPDVLPDVPEGAEVIQDFPLGRMRMDKIGTGEGAQAYGHGLYAAEHEPIAKGYRDRLSRNVAMEKAGTPIPWGDYFTEIQSAAQVKGIHRDQAYSIAKSISDLMDEGKTAQWIAKNYEPPTGFEDAWNSALQAASLYKKNKTPGKVYEVNIAADPNQFLDWDKPLSEQPNLMRALGNYDPEYYVDYDEIIDKAMRSLRPVSEPTGEDIYRALGHPKTATRMLNTMGVPGIRYLDAGSRGVGDGTRNIVVFDDKLISIIRKYGIAGASAMLGYNLMEQLDPKQALAASMADQDYQSSRPQRSMGGNNSVSGALNVARKFHGVR